MSKWFKEKEADITADMNIYVEYDEELESMSAEELVDYIDVVPSWDCVEPDMWDYIAYWYDIPDMGEDFDPEVFLELAKAARKRKEEEAE